MTSEANSRSALDRVTSESKKGKKGRLPRGPRAPGGVCRVSAVHPLRTGLASGGGVAGMEEAWPRPGPLAAEAFDARCDMTMRPYRLGEMMKDKMDAVIGSDDAAAVRRVVH
jgi:hypothetical protein